MEYNFDEIIDRRNTNSLKYDFAAERGMPDGLLPLWVADMDFRSPPCVLSALHAAAEHGVFGYSAPKDDWFDPVLHWFSTHFDYEIRREWIVQSPGVVFALSAAVRAFTDEGDGVLIQRPVYYPFSNVIRLNNRRIVNNPLFLADGSYRIDFEDFERKLVENKVKLFIFCSPHNPVGRVWRREELERLGAICQRHGCVIVSDEIHCDFVFPGHRHTVFAGLSPALAESIVTCTAPSKTFNLAGLQISNIVIRNEALRRKFSKEVHRVGYDEAGAFGLAACHAAYESGGDWLRALRAYLTDNLSFLRDFLRDRLPRVRLIEPEGTCLIWMDFRELGLSAAALDELIVKKAGLWLDGGTMFGEEGAGFQRINIACPRDTLRQALVRLESAVLSI
ncbi:MAG: pyridoxal phosphate-dependent aminotransferase [Clostridiales Family XIII bacterium]|jgi:cystathionine beta-lyase|nr:pyridoxal phosphate-dependent aminotransferase [Clostridiales Family XIII bacterium]